METCVSETTVVLYGMKVHSLWHGMALPVRACVHDTVQDRPVYPFCKILYVCVCVCLATHIQRP